ncbi:MAG: hypothetical protein GYA31_02790 [Parcubacteria group bacterium]|nr:hypothetical protein [Parcubacteria group bacterium]
MKNDLTVIIPTKSNQKGLEYLKGYFKDKDYQIKIVDNSKKNLGFAKAVNLVIGLPAGAFRIREAKVGDQRLVDSKWLLILNDDVEFLEKTQNSNPRSQIQNLKLENYKSEKIEKLMEFAEEKKLDAVSPILVNPKGEIENMGYKILPIGKIALITNHQSPTTNHQIDGLTAACLLVKTNVFKKLGGFDVRFFAYLEDVDFFIRFKKAGYKFGVCQEVKVLHRHMTTSKKMGSFKERQDLINWWRLYLKHPDRFKLNLAFVIERLRNVSGLVKAIFRNNK